MPQRIDLRQRAVAVAEERAGDLEARVGAVDVDDRRRRRTRPTKPRPRRSPANAGAPARDEHRAEQRDAGRAEQRQRPARARTSRRAASRSRRRSPRARSCTAPASPAERVLADRRRPRRQREHARDERDDERRARPGRRSSAASRHRGADVAVQDARDRAQHVHRGEHDRGRADDGPAPALANTPARIRNSPAKLADSGTASAMMPVVMTSVASAGRPRAMPPSCAKTPVPVRRSTEPASRKSAAETSPWLTDWSTAPSTPRSFAAKRPSVIRPICASDE